MPRRPRKRSNWNDLDDHDDTENYDEPEDDHHDTDDQSPSNPRRRRRRAVNYMESDDEESNFENGDGINPEPKPDLPTENYDEPENEELHQPAGKRRRLNRGRANRHSSDEEYHSPEEEEEEEDDDDEYMSQSELEKDIARRKERDFIINDGGDDEDDYEYGVQTKQNRRGRPRKKGRLSGKMSLKSFAMDAMDDYTEENVAEGGDEEDVDDIQREIADLNDDTAKDASPVTHKLRERTKVDYTIPPPITNDLQFDLPARPGTPRRGRGRPTNVKKNEFRKILYPTAGPFGGSDVISLFGTNIPPGGIPIPGMPTTNNNLTAIGQNLSDSDSSEDEIAPINGEATVSKKKPKSLAKVGVAPDSNSVAKLITGGSDDSKNKKKSNLSDTDPLGIDMNIDFSVVGGLDSYINQLKEMVALPLLYPELYQNFKITPPRGVLFHGPPGTGKTLMARALAASCSTAERKITFFMRKGADCLSKWVGEAERQLRLLFEEAKNQQPSIIFFDEIDGLAPVRSSKQEQIHASIVSTLLALMDGMDNRGQVIVIGATNRPDAIDPALRRPGRFDREFYFPLPDIGARKEILKIHTRDWTPQLPDVFVVKLAELTKGYGGADLRALCTEAALHSIQRKYPQIYSTNEKLLVNPSKVKVIAKDFMKAIDKIIPSSARSTSSGSAPLPDHLKPLLQECFSEITTKLNELLPNSVSKGQKKITNLDEAHYLDPTTKDEDGGFGKLQILKNLESSRICRPHLLIGGQPGLGQQYLAQAILNYLEGFQVQSLDLGTIFGDSTRTPDLAVVQAFIEARRHQPSIIFIPNIDLWFQIVPSSARATLLTLVRNLNSSERVLMLGISEVDILELDHEIKLVFGFESDANNVCLRLPGHQQREIFFENLRKKLLMKPIEFVNDLENRPKRKLKQLPVVKSGDEEKLSQAALEKKKLKEQEYNDTKLKNVLKIKLAGLMDLFKNRYKRFRKPVIDENYLYHLFDPSVLTNPMAPYEVLYEKSTDPGHENMIKELSTGRYYFNMDLDTIEERLWNGYYSEPKQFLKDIKMIVKDSITCGDRERILKANEMLTNAQFGIDDFSTPEFLKACKEVRERDLEKQQKLLEEHRKLQLEFENTQAMNLQTLTNAPMEGAEQKSAIDDDNAEQNGLVVSTVPETSETPNAVAETAEVNAMEVVGPKDEVTEESKDEVMEESSEPVQPEEEQQTTNQVTEETDNEDDDSESEAEVELEVDHTKQLIVDTEKLNDLYNKVVEISEGFNIERLEITMARCMDIIWKDRNQWDKTSTLVKLHETLEAIRSSL